ncbi:MAG: FAD-dependent oxidoreductase [Verrucomicrobia bacterium]|nr:FAD-dependent oxidoreductase [Verrucomicrobiota bacterium]
MKVGVIGAGISGLVCARALHQQGHQVTVLEKSRSLGGRCATRKFGDHLVDHGLQYFTLRDPDVRREVEALAGDELLRLTAPILQAEPKGAVYREGEERFYLRSGNNRFGKMLAAELELVTETEVPKVEKSWRKWKAAGREFDAVVSCAPWPQSASLLGLRVADPGYDPCLTVLLEYQVGRADGEGAYARRNPSGSDPLGWIACENVKAGRVAEGCTVYVIQASPEYSRQHLEQSPEYWASDLQVLLEKVWNLDPAKRASVFAHRWRHARRRENAPAPTDLPKGFFLCGDSWTDSRLESVWKSGQRTAEKVLAL